MNTLLIPAAALLWACLHPRHTDQVVLLPEPDGRPSAVTLQRGVHTLVLDQPYAVALLGADGPRPGQATHAQDVRQRYGALLSAQPPRPQTWQLYFETGQNSLSAEALSVVQDIRAALAQRPAPEVMVIGHTDNVGQADLNDALSLRRAQLVRELLGQQGVDLQRVEAVGRGSREPLVPTPAQTAEPRNRRVDILVR